MHLPTIRRHPFYALTGVIVTLCLIAFFIIHFYLDDWLLNYVNRVLNDIPGYEGNAESINVNLYRGAYRINRLKINKKNGRIPVPFISIEQTDFSVQWRALMHGRIVSDSLLIKPVINFAVNESQAQNGSEADWTKPIKDLTPIDINHVYFKEGLLTYQDFSSHPKVNIYIRNMEGEISNLRNVVNREKELPSTLVIKGYSIGDGNLSIKGNMNILKEIPDMDMLIKLENVHLPALNNYSNAYASFDFKDGEFDLYSEFIVKNDQVSGYIKPIARNIKILDLHKTTNPFKITWESLVSIVVSLFTNQAHDQFATKIDLEGNLKNVSTNKWSALTGIVHNAFISALRKGLDANGESKVLKEQP